MERSGEVGEVKVSGVGEASPCDGLNGARKSNVRSDAMEIAGSTVCWNGVSTRCVPNTSKTQIDMLLHLSS